jgi:sentrin-specific protease 1
MGSGLASQEGANYAVEGEAEEFPLISAVAADMVRDARRATNSKEGAEVLLTTGGNHRVEVLREHMQTLTEVTWLNDVVINAYLGLLTARSQQDVQLPKLWTFNSFFYKKLKDESYEGVTKWTKHLPGKGIFDYDLIILPINNPGHWTCGAINFRQKRIEYYDSTGGTAGPFFSLMRGYLKKEARKRGVPFNPGEWTNYIPKDIPHQDNHFDCGLFTVRYAEYLSREAPFTFTQQDIPYLRERTAFEILTQRLLPRPGR